MKRFFALTLALLIMAMSLGGCTQNAAQLSDTSDTKSSDAVSGNQDTAKGHAEDVIIRIGGIKGPTSMGMVKLIEDNENGSTKNKYEFSLAGSADELVPKLVKGDLDIAAVPLNLAATLYNNTDGQIKLLAVNTLGVLYLVERGDTIHSVEDLKGRTIVASGKGSTPEIALRHILSRNGLNPDKDIKVEWKSEQTEVLQTMAQNEDVIGLLPQPFVTVAQGQVDGLHIVLDFTEEWNNLGDGSMLMMGALAVRKDFAEAHPEQIQTFLGEYEYSVLTVKGNPSYAAKIIEKYDIVKADIAEKAIPYCNIVCIKGSEMVVPVKGFLQVLFDSDPKTIGEKIPDDDFYYR